MRRSWARRPRPTTEVTLRGENFLIQAADPEVTVNGHALVRFRIDDDQRGLVGYFFGTLAGPSADLGANEGRIDTWRAGRRSLAPRRGVPLPPPPGNRLDLLRLRWVEGLVSAGQGHMEDAFAAFEEVRSRFLELEMPYDAALATLQLAVLHAAQGGRSAEVKALAAEAAPIFEAEEVHAEARKALAVFRAAAAEERVTVELARAVAEYLERARGAPGMRFEGGG